MTTGISAPTSTTGALQINGTDAVTFDATGILTGLGSKRVLQVAAATPYTTYTNTAATLPFDDTAPLSSEGLQILTATITPQSSASSLMCIWFFTGAASTSAGHISVAVFRDGTAKGTVSGGGDNVQMSNLSGSFIVAAGSTASTTFTLNYGVDTGTAYVNGTSSGRKFGGVSAAYLFVIEVAA